MEKAIASLIFVVSTLLPCLAAETEETRTEDSVQAEIDSLTQARESLRPQLQGVGARLDSLGDLKRELAAADTAAGEWELSTYDWDYEPYLDLLKQHVEVELFSDPAFRDLDFSGHKIRVRFEVPPSGKFRRLEMFDEEGTPLGRDLGVESWSMFSLVRPLPTDFPDTVLVVEGLVDNPVVMTRPQVEKVTEVLVLSEAVGEVIDAAERDRYGLFKKVKGFVSATYYKRPDGTYFLELVTRDDTGEEHKRTNRVVRAGIDFARSRITRSQE